MNVCQREIFIIAFLLELAHTQSYALNWNNNKSCRFAFGSFLFIAILPLKTEIEFSAKQFSKAATRERMGRLIFPVYLLSCFARTSFANGEWERRELNHASPRFSDCFTIKLIWFESSRRSRHCSENRTTLTRAAGPVVCSVASSSCCHSCEMLILNSRLSARLRSLSTSRQASFSWISTFSTPR